MAHWAVWPAGKEQGMMDRKLGVIGFGNMATGILNAVIKSEVLTMDEISVYEIDDKARRRAEQAGYFVTESMAQLCRSCALTGPLLLAQQGQGAGKFRIFRLHLSLSPQTIFPGTAGPRS